MDATAIGRLVEQRRRAAGLTQVELGRRIGTTQPAVSKIEAGRSLPGIDLLERVARATGRPITLTLGPSAWPRISNAVLRDRLRRVLGDVEFDPWDRDPSPAEQESLIADGLTRERFGG
jgi:transcriptional regulator with XRE-family HTH domain